MWLLAFVLVMTVAALALRRSRWATLSLRLSRWAYGLFIVLSLLYFPAKSGFLLATPTCEWKFGLALAMHSLTNYRHMILFTIFFLLTYAQLPNVPKAVIWSAAACMVMGFLVELAQGASGHGHCRMRDQIPNAVGALTGALLVMIGSKVWTHKRTQTSPSAESTSA